MMPDRIGHDIRSRQRCGMIRLEHRLNTALEHAGNDGNIVNEPAAGLKTNYLFFFYHSCNGMMIPEGGFSATIEVRLTEQKTHGMNFRYVREFKKK